MNAVLLAALAVGVVCPGSDHANAVQAARRDVLNPESVPPFLQEKVRYLDFSDVPWVRLGNARKVLAGHVNQLSRNPQLRIPVMVTPTLMRIVLDDYKWKREVWEQLADSEPYLHTTLVKGSKEEFPWPGGVWHEDGKYYPPGAFQCERVLKADKRVGAIQLHTLEEYNALVAGKIKESDTAIGQLIAATNSRVPIVDAIWFFQQTITDLDRKPGYHDFLGFNDQDEYEKLLGFNEKQILEFSDLLREAVARSEVVSGKRPRRFEILDKPKGHLFRTLDSFITRDKNNPLRVNDGTLRFDASEQFGNLANGFLAWGLFDNKRVRQDRAPDRAAGTKKGAANVTMILNAVECIHCHDNAGVKDFQPYFRTLFQSPRGLQAPTYEDFLRQSRQYLETLDDAVDTTRRLNARAIQLTTGYTPQEWSYEVYDLWRYYIEAEVDVYWAARSLGVSVDQFQDSLAAMQRKRGYIDPVLATFLRPPAKPLAIETWEEVYPIAQSYLRGISP